jgi:hypothetical protein
LVEELNIKKAEVAPRSKFSFKSKKSNATSGSEERAIETENKEGSNVVPTILDTTSSITDEKFQVITLNSKQNSYLTINSYLSSPSTTNDSTKTMDFHILNLQNCFINLVSKSVTIGAIHIKGLKDCVILAGPVDSSILIYDCESCVFVVACHQVKYFFLKRNSKSNTK